MFAAMMKGIAQDFVKYVMHVQVVKREERERPAPARCRTCSRPRPTTTSRAVSLGLPRPPPPMATSSPRPARPRRAVATQTAAPAKQETVVKSDWEKTPRNAPCPCGSGKKYKQCHGAA